MTSRPDPSVLGLRSLPHAILLGAALFAVVPPFVQWSVHLIGGRFPLPPLSVWVGFIAVQAVAGACAGAIVYAAGRLPPGRLRICLFGIANFLFIGGRIEEFVHEPLYLFLSFWALSSLIGGVILGVVIYPLWRRKRRRAVAYRESGDDP
ncbi:MAG TPA: hypothetical protein VHG08_10435 [Longimicrobium sp.]|nr:hypothetical protein [Longimicrobium sp.]